MPARRKTEPSTKDTNLHANTTSTPSILRIKNTQGNVSHRIEKIEKPRRTSPRLQEKLLNTLSSLEPPKKSSSEYDDQTETRKRKRGREGEHKSSLSPENSKKAPPAKPAKMSIVAVPIKPQPLTAKNLQIHTLREGYLDKLELINTEPDEDCRSRGSETSASLIEIETTSSITEDNNNASQIAQRIYMATHFGIYTPVGGASLM